MTFGLGSEVSSSSLLHSASVFSASLVIDAYSVSPVEQIGANVPIEPPAVTPETIATICYTSVRSFNSHKPEPLISVPQGTTGNPKGAILTQGALASATYSNTCGMDVTPFLAPVLLSFLPLAHIYGVRFLSRLLLGVVPPDRSR